MTNTQVFNVSTAGLYPFERYIATPITFTVGTLPTDFTSIFWSQLDGSGSAISTGGSLITRNFLNYHKNPLCQLLNYTDPYYNQFVSYENVTYTKFSNKFQTSLTQPICGTDTSFIERVATITLYNTTTNGSTITLNTSAIRQNYKSPYEFYFFYIQLNDRTKNSYGYLLYPSRIFLRPRQITNNNGKWQFITNVNVISSTIVHIQSSDIEKDALDLHQNRLLSLPSNIVSLPENICSADNKIYFYLYGSRTSINSSLLSPSSAFSLVPSQSSFYLNEVSNQGDIAYVHPDSTFFSFSAIYINSNNQKDSLTQASKSDSYFYNAQKFNPAFVLTYNPIISNKQNYQLVQSLINSSYLLGETQNTVLSASIGMNDGFIDFYSYPTSQVKFDRAFPLRVDYLVDSYNLYTANVAASSTLTSQQLSANNGVTSYTQNIVDSFLVYNISGSDIMWETTYPPYCYSYKLKLTDPSDSYLDSNYLNFYLKHSILYQDSVSVKLSSFMVSDFDALKIPISETDTISFKIISTSIENDADFINNINCYYGTDTNLANQNYNIVTSPYVPVQNGAYLKIDYTDARFKGIKFSVQGSIKTASGIIDAFKTADISLDPPERGTGNKIFLNIIDEKSNEITVDASYNVTEQEWPAIDLRDSNVKWSYGNGNNLILNYVDIENDFIAPVTGAAIFNSNTWRVKLSGYGPYMATLSLSSEKYNQVATVSSNPSLFDFLSLGRIKVGHIQPLNNLDFTRSITLTAAIPYGNNLFNIPTNIPINWTWEYDDLVNPESQPIRAEQPLYNNKNYIYGINMMPKILSSIKINVTPGYSDTYPKLHDVRVIATINSTQPTITGLYEFKVDDFPSKRLFNCDFDTFYTDFKDNPSYSIANTRNNKNTITRSETSVLNFTFSANRDVLSTINGGTLAWAYSGKKTSVSDYTYGIDLTNPVSGLPTKTINGIPASSLDIDLTLTSAYAPGWTSAHNVSATTHLYVIDSQYFYKPLQFILFPEYAWLNETTVTFLSTDPLLENYFTNAFAPTAYLYKKSSSQTFWFSANKTFFTDYIYQNKQNYSIVSAKSAYDVLDFPYNSLHYTVVAGVPVSLVAYNDSFYPENMDIVYIDQLRDTNFVPLNQRIASLGNTYLVTQTHQITAATQSVTKFSDTNIYDNFSKSPKFKLYDDVVLRYTAFCNDQPTQYFNIDLSGSKISVEQVFELIPENSPALISTGTVTYYLSTLYWTVSTTVPAGIVQTSAYHDIFFIKYGDPSIPLYGGEMGVVEYYLYADADLKQQIPWTTFSKYPSSYFRYPKDPSLWEEIII